MPITHNLSVINNPSSGVNPLAGRSIGETIGRSWLLWKIFSLYSAFDTNVKLITNSYPTPSFLQSEAGTNLQTEPELNRSVIGDFIRFYRTDDLGLVQSTPNAIIYEWRIQSINSLSLCTIRLRSKISGDTTYTPGEDDNIINGNTNNHTQAMYILPSTSATWVLNDSNINGLFGNLIFWKSSNANLIMSIKPSDNSFLGYWLYFTCGFTGFRSGIGTITNGQHINCRISLPPFGTGAYIEAVTKNYNATAMSNCPDNLSPIVLAGQLPSSLFSISGEDRLIYSKLRFGVKSDSQFKIISDEIEGVIVGHQAATGAVGTIQKYNPNNQYYLHGHAINDGRDSNYRPIFLLGG